MPLKFLILLFILSLASAGKPTLCVTKTTMPHQGVPVPFGQSVTVRVPLRIHHICPKHRPRSPPSLLIFMPGALARPFDYSMLANRLARAGFVVAIPRYASRNLFESLSPTFDAVAAFTRQNRRMGFKCPRKGQFPSVKLITSTLNFFINRNRKHREKRTIVNLRSTLIFGHSFGGALTQFFFNDFCAPVTEPVIPPPVPLAFDPQASARFACEQFVPFRNPRVNIRGVVTFEGFNSNFTIPANNDTFYVAVHSPFFDDQVEDFFPGRDFGGNLAIVRISKANHYGPANFVKENNNQRPVCMQVRPPPEDAFMTTRKRQNRVVRSIARTVVASFKVFVQRKGRRALKRLERQRDLFVDRVMFQ